MSETKAHALRAITLEPIGIIRTPHKSEEGTPIQPKGAMGIQGFIELKVELAEGLKDLDGFSHAYLIYMLDRCDNFKLTIMPFMDTEEHGVFATRSPKRPCPVGLSIVKILSIENNIVKIENVDMLDRTPLLDIKPYVPEMDNFKTEKNGWLEKNHHKSNNMKADERFKE